MQSTEHGGERTAWSFAEPWGGTGRVADLDGPVHWVDFGGPPGSTPLVLVHGLGGSHLNWVQVAAAWTAQRRVVAVDLPGFGLSTAGSRTASVSANAAVLDRFLRNVVGGPAVLVGNSMGGMISLLQTGARPESVAGLVLVDPSLPVPRSLPDRQVAAQFLMYAVPGFGERYMAYTARRMTDEQLVQRVVNLCFADPSRASEQLLAASAALVAERRKMPAQNAAFLQAARSLLRVLARPSRYQALMSRIDVPVLLIHGDRDRLVPVAAARAVLAANPKWEGVILKGVGHTPQLEDPDDVVEHVANWLDQHALDSPAGSV
jgi:pimeloyl-ACP methyl ester carboxylesterase